MNYDEAAIKADETAQELRVEARQEEEKRRAETRKNADRVKQAFFVLDRLYQTHKEELNIQAGLESVEKGLLETAKQFFDQEIPREQLVEAFRRFMNKIISDNAYHQKISRDIAVSHDLGLSAIPNIAKTDFVPDEIIFSRGRKPDGEGRQVIVSVGQETVVLERRAALAFYKLAAKNGDTVNTGVLAEAIQTLKNLKTSIDQRGFNLLMRALSIEGKNLIDQDIPRNQLVPVLREFIRLPWQQREPLMESVRIDPPNVTFGDIPNIASDNFEPEKIQFYPGKLINGDGREVRFSVPMQNRSWNGRETKQHVLVTLHGPAAEAFYNLALSSK